MIRAKVLGRKPSERLSKPDLKATFSDVCLVKTELRSNDRTIQVICFVKAMYHLHVFRRNPRDGCYLHEQKNDIIKTQRPRRFCGGSEKSRFQWIHKELF